MNELPNSSRCPELRSSSKYLYRPLYVVLHTPHDGLNAFKCQKFKQEYPKLRNTTSRNSCHRCYEIPSRMVALTCMTSLLNKFIILRALSSFHSSVWIKNFISNCICIHHFLSNFIFSILIFPLIIVLHVWATFELFASPSFFSICPFPSLPKSFDRTVSSSVITEKFREPYWAFCESLISSHSVYAPCLVTILNGYIHTKVFWSDWSQ